MKKNTTELKIEKVLTTWGIVVILWSIFRANFFPPLWFSEFIAKPLIFLVPVYFFLKNTEKTDNFLVRLGFPKKALFKEIFISLLLIVFVLGLGLLSFYLSKEIKIIFLNKLDLVKLISLFILALASAFSEEVFGRGFLFRYLYKYSKSFLISLFISSVLFFVLYLPGALTLKLGGQDLLMNLVINFTLSFITGIAVYLRKNVVPAIAIHAAIMIWFDLLLSGI